jgi:hypothetical protein
MAILFRSSAETSKEFVAKVLVYGPSNSGKTHFGLGAPEPILLDVENRGRSFGRRQTEFNFQHAEIETTDDLREAFRQIRSGKVAGKSIVTDSGSAIYNKFVMAHSKMNDAGNLVTEWPMVNRQFLAMLDFTFSIIGKNVVFTMHQGQKLARKGRDFEQQGVQFIGDEKFRYGFDYIFRIEPIGSNPNEHHAKWHVEKSVSPNLPVGGFISDLTWEKFERIATAPTKSDAPTETLPAAEASANSPRPINDGQRVRIDDLTEQLRLGQMELADAVKDVTDGRTPMVSNLNAGEALRLIRALEQRAKGAA